MKGSTLRKRTSGMAMAIAIATGAVITTGALIAEPAHAQKKKKDKAEKAQYSDEFVAAYNPVNEAFKTEGANVAALKPQIIALIPLSQSPDEKMAAGGLIYNAAVSIKDAEMQLQGMEMMIASGKVPATAVGQYNFIAYQLSNQAEDYAKARDYLQAAIDANFTTETVTPTEMQVAMAESYFAEGLNQNGLATLNEAINARRDMGQAVDERWYRRGISVAYTNQLRSELSDLLLGWISDYPSQENWRESINVVRNLSDFESPEMLDLLRLAAEIGTINNQQDVSIFVESADARRLPLEVKRMIEKAYAEGIANRDDIYLADQLTTANQVIPNDRADLPDIEAEANGSSDLKIVMAAADVFLSYGEYAKAERFYSKALTLPGVETQMALTRLGMAQVWLGKTEEAKATFAKVTGNRKPIAQLWTAYADAQAGPATTASIGAN